MKSMSEQLYRADISKIHKVNVTDNYAKTVEDNELAEAMLPFVISIATKFRWAESIQGIDYMDILQEGNLSLLSAIKTWNPKKNMSFLPWVKMYVTRAINRFINKHKLPYSVQLNDNYNYANDEILNNSPEELMSIDQDIKQFLESLYSRLPTKQLIAVVERLGLADGNPRNFSQIAETYNVSHAAIRKLYLKGIKALQAH